MNFFYNNIFNWEDFGRTGKGLAKNILILIFKTGALIAAGLKKTKIINN
jgi:hypothetical protein